MANNNDKFISRENAKTLWGYMIDLLTGKQNKLTFDETPTQSSDNPVKSGGIFTALSGKGTYSKPQNGIPKTDLENAVQTSLGLADSALQSETDPTVPSWAKQTNKPSYTQDEVGDGTTYKRVSSTEKDTWNAKGTYSKPSGGIPKSDLASAVQTSLEKADSALQSETDPTVPSWAKQSNKPSYNSDEISDTNRNHKFATQSQLDQISTNQTNILLLNSAVFAKAYGYRINKNDNNPATRVEYILDAVGMTPAGMTYSNGVGTFSYGSWSSVDFVAKNRPVALNFDGTVAYELNHTDYSKKLDGTASDVTDASANYNFMSEMPLWWVKRWEDDNYNYVVFSEKQTSEDYRADAFTNANGIVQPYMYLPMFKGWVDTNNKLRSIAGKTPKGDTTGANEKTYAENVGTGWQPWDWSKWNYIHDLLVLLGRSTDIKSKFGYGVCGQNGVTTSPTYGKQPGGGYYATPASESGFSLATGGQFTGYYTASTVSNGTNPNWHHVSTFYVEDLWGNRWDRCLGLNRLVNNYKVKMSPPYNVDSDNTYRTIPDVMPSEGWLLNTSGLGEYGSLPNKVNASATTGYTCYFHKNNDTTMKLALVGGDCHNGAHCGRYVLVDYASSVTYWAIGASPCFVNP